MLIGFRVEIEMMKTLNLWKCRYCKSTNIDLKNKAKNNKIKCLECGKINKVAFNSGNKKMRLNKFFGIFLTLTGVIFILNSFSSITGFAVAESVGRGASSILGFVFVVGGMMLFVSRREKIHKKKDLEDVIMPKGGKKKIILSIGNNDPCLLKLAREAAKSYDIKKDINHLMYEYFVKQNSILELPKHLEEKIFLET